MEDVCFVMMMMMMRCAEHVIILESLSLPLSISFPALGSFVFAEIDRSYIWREANKDTKINT